MSARLLFLLFLLCSVYTAPAQDRNVDMWKRAHHNEYRNGHRTLITMYSKTDGYIVYKGDTLTGYITIDRSRVYFERHTLGDSIRYYNIKLKDPDLKTIMMYNYDQKPLCITRIRPEDKKMKRVLHEGKLNIYDDWMKYIYKPSDIDPFLIVVSYQGEVDELGSFAKEGTKRDLIGYINDIYNMKINPRTTTWKDLLFLMDSLD